LALVAGAAAAAERSVECPKEHPASILGRVLGPDGEPIAGAKVTLPGGDSSQVYVVDSSGRFAFYCVVASASYELEVEARGFETKVVSPVVAAAPPQEIEVVLSPAEDAPPNNSLQRTNGLRPFAAELMIR
jgi:hypothetical protein